jgi:hypothetical protein
VLPVTFFLIFGLVIGAIGVFRYQETAHIARETARFASVHGGQYAKVQAAAIAAGTFPSVDKNYLIQVAKANAAGLDTSMLQVTVTMTVIPPGATSPTTESVDWDNITENQNRSPYSAWTNETPTPPQNVQLENVVTVTVSYQWTPQLYLVGPITLSSTAVMPMSY